MRINQISAYNCAPNSNQSNNYKQNKQPNFGMKFEKHFVDFLIETCNNEPKLLKKLSKKLDKLKNVGAKNTLMSFNFKMYSDFVITKWDERDPELINYYLTFFNSDLINLSSKYKPNMAQKVLVRHSEIGEKSKRRFLLNFLALPKRDFIESENQLFRSTFDLNSIDSPDEAKVVYEKIDKMKPFFKDKIGVRFRFYRNVIRRVTKNIETNVLAKESKENKLIVRKTVKE